MCYEKYINCFQVNPISIGIEWNQDQDFLSGMKYDYTSLFLI